MKKFVLFIIITFFWSLSGCSAKIQSFIDPVSRVNIVRMCGNRLSGGITSVELNAQRFNKTGIISYSLFIIYSGPTFINIPPGNTLILTIDGQRFEIPGQGSEKYRNHVSIGLIEEKAYYHDVDPGLLERVAYAKAVNVEIIGNNKILERYFKINNFINFQEFYEFYVKSYAGQ